VKYKCPAASERVNEYSILMAKFRRDWIIREIARDPVSFPAK